VDNDRNQVELLTALLLSLPGSPVLYYGDEIGMGDNIWLADRDAVRTPMQWTPDRNAGFSRAEPGRLYLPVIMDPIYGYQAVNVEAQKGCPWSLLHWTRHMLAVRKQHNAFGLGDCVELPGSNPSVLSFLRRHEDDLLLCVFNLSSRPQLVDIDLPEHGGHELVELTGNVSFGRTGPGPVRLTLPRHGYYWLGLTPVTEQP
jgi:maltose alpha-D-glucosyltransferase/alpha-amylase